MLILKKQPTHMRCRTQVSPTARLPFLAGWPIALAVSFATAFAVAQEDDGGETTEAEEQTEAAEADGPVETVVVTGSRVARQPSELSRNVIVLDEQAIRATGEFTLPRVLQQLPQNTNPTNATYGSQLNGVNNKTGAATVNLRGLGSESTLILVDGRRVGYSGILGGVTDISTIPLSMVERIEVLLDGASAVYGSDAVGGVVNIITRKSEGDMEGSVSTRFGSFNTLEFAGSVGGALNDRFNFDLGALHREQGDNYKLGKGGRTFGDFVQGHGAEPRRIQAAEQD